MRTLALDTTTRAGSVALVAKGAIVTERAGDGARSHGERLPAELLDLLASTGVTLDRIDLFAVASGPGGFTGLRVGIATIQGLAFVARRQVVPISALEAHAYRVLDEAAEAPFIGAWMDAHRGDVFSALYRVDEGSGGEDGRLAEVEASAVGDPYETAERWRQVAAGGAVVVTGDGVARYGEAVARCGRVWAPDHPTIAGVIGRLAELRAARGLAIGPMAIRPLYVRRPDAELDREKRARDVALGH
jgi:tRNA threonylcarbamoyladenosine biosynthesis protein TsaB